MGRYGLRSGYGKFQNIQSGSVDITVDGSGDGTQAVVFPHIMKTVPIVVLTQQEADTTGTLNATSVTVSGFTAKIDGSSVTSDDVTCGWIAMDQKA
jgi:hypothetical protein